MPENAIIPDGEAVQETAKEKFERERLSRRQALKRLGMTSAMATFALFSVDDLARMVGKAMQQRAADNKVVEQVAKELQQAGIALAQPGTPCSHCQAEYTSDDKKANNVYNTCMTTMLGTGMDQFSANIACMTTYCKTMNDSLFDYNGCCAANCPGGCTKISVPFGCMYIPGVY